MDLTSPKTIRNIQNQFGFTFKKGLGQNFLTSPDVLDEIVAAAEIDGGVVEVGPGFGVLTRELAKSAEKVVSIELDERLLEVLEYTLADCDNVKIINGDVLKLDLEKLLADEFPNQKVSIAANLPYYITTPIITRLLEEKLPVSNIVVMVQKEVAMRLRAKPSTKDYGAITLLCQYYTEPEIVTVVPAGLFVPPPKVDSAVLKLKVLEKPRVSVKDEKMFFRVIKAAFSQRRKTLLNCLASGFSMPKEELAKLTEDAGIECSRRGETLSIEEFAILADKMAERIKTMDKEDKLAFGEELLKARRRRGLSRQQLADIIGVSPSAIGNYENHINYPDIKKAIKIADALGVSLDRLLMDPEFEKRLGINHVVIEAENQTDRMI